MNTPKTVVIVHIITRYTPESRDFVVHTYLMQAKPEAQTRSYLSRQSGKFGEKQKAR